MKNMYIKVWVYRLFALLLILCIAPQLISSVAAKQFPDVVRTQLPDYFDAINYVSDNGIMNGESDTAFAPNAYVTRAAFISALYRYAGKPADYISSMEFTDISNSHWAYNAVRWGAKYMIVSGTSPTTFEPDKVITREQAMTFLYRYLTNYQFNMPYAVGSIADCGDYSSISYYAQAPVLWAVSNGIISASGTSKLLYPKSNVYRKELALWIQRYGLHIDGIRFGQDNFNYLNATNSFDLDENGRIRISQAHYDWLRAKTTDYEWNLIERNLNEPFQGVCFGMALSALLDKRGIIDFNKNLTVNISTMYAMPAPSTTTYRHYTAPDRFNAGQVFPASESVIAFYQATQHAQRVLGLSYRENYASGNAFFSDLLSKLKSYGCLLISLRFEYNGKSAGHAVAAYGVPKQVGNYYEIRCYDANKSSEQILKIATDYSSCIYTFGGSTIYPEIPRFLYDFYAFSPNFDIDGEYNSSYSSTVSPYGVSTSESHVLSNVAEDSLWVTLPLNDFILTNDQGDVLKSKDGFFTDDSTMEVLEIGGSFVNIRVRVAYSDSFTIQTDASDAYIGVQWDSGHAFQLFHSDNGNKIAATITRNSVSVEGEIENYWLSAYADTNTSVQYQMVGKEATFLYLRHASTSASAESSAAYELQVRDLHSGKVFSNCTSSGTTRTLINEANQGEEK